MVSETENASHTENLTLPGSGFRGDLKFNTFMSLGCGKLHQEPNLSFPVGGRNRQLPKLAKITSGHQLTLLLCE
jgi:hypothetical protein